MLASQLLVALTAISSFALASPATLQRRDQKLTISYCNSCLSKGGAPICTQTPYIHWGDSKLGGCKDSSIPMNNNFCSAYGKIPTPQGSGTWSTSGAGCGAGVDQIVGKITTDNRSVYTCYKANGYGFTNNCGGLTYACSTSLSCYGP